MELMSSLRQEPSHCILYHLKSSYRGPCNASEMGVAILKMLVKQDAKILLKLPAREPIADLLSKAIRADHKNFSFVRNKRKEILRCPSCNGSTVLMKDSKVI